MRMMFCLVALFLFVPMVPAQREAKVPDPDPEIERKSFKVADGFEVNLFAADPQLAKPIQMNFDSAGRLWLACSETYPQIKPGQKANDKIIVLEDTKGVGKADKVSVFADGLLIPTGLEIGDGGVYVVNSTDLVHLSSRKGNGKADTRRVVLSGFGTEDTHHMVHTLRWGHDGNLYFNQSVYIHSHIETPHGVRRLNAGGIWQFRPDTLELEVFVRGFWNTWGHHFDRFGQSFITDGAGFMGIAIGFPGAAYDPAPGAFRTLKGLNMGSPKYCGLEIVSGRHLPDDWQGSLVTCDFRANRVVRFALTPNGSGFNARLMPDVIRATHPAFRPIDVKMGPDGAIYVADWYNPIIQHGEVDFRDPRRDVTHGRIWRITRKGQKLVPRLNLPKATPAELVKHLEAPEGWTRHFARRELYARGWKEAEAPLRDWVKSLDATRPENEPHLLEGLWTYQTFNKLNKDLLYKLLGARDSRVRAAAVRVLAAWNKHIPDTPGLLAARVADEDPLVRREAISALWTIRSVRSAETALRALDRSVDTYIDYALALALHDQQSLWLPALQAGKFDYGGNIRRLTFALQAVGSEKVVRPLVQLVKSGKVTGEQREGVLALLGSVGGPGELALVFNEATKGKDGPWLRLLQALEETARQRGVAPSGSREKLVSLLQSKDESIQRTAAHLAGLWKIEAARNLLTTLAQDAKGRLEVRQSAIEGLAGLGGASKEVLSNLAERGDSPAIRQSALIALAGLDLNAGAKHIVALMEASKDGAGVGEVIEAFLSRKGGPGVLVKTLQGKKLPIDAARVALRTVRTSGRPAPALVEAITQAGGLKSASRVLSPKELKDLVAEVQERGNAVRGEAIYRRADQLCMKCHAIGGAGGQVGPDLSSIGGSAQVDYLIESLLQPSKAIKENYHATLVTTSLGKQYTGIKVRQTGTALILRNDQDKEIAIPLKSIEEQGASKVSLMPEGLTDPLTRAELVDLVKFLSSLGKGEQWSISRQRVARRWQVLEVGNEVYRMLNRKGLSALVRDEPGLNWGSAYSTVSGSLPVDVLPRFRIGKDGPQLSLLRTQLDVTTASKVRLLLKPTKGVSLWLDGEPVTPAEVMQLDLKPGVHTLALTVEQGANKEVRLEVEDTPTSAGVRFVGGK